MVSGATGIDDPGYNLCGRVIRDRFGDIDCGILAAHVIGARLAFLHDASNGGFLNGSPSRTP